MTLRTLWHSTRKLPGLLMFVFIFFFTFKMTFLWTFYHALHLFTGSVRICPYMYVDKITCFVQYVLIYLEISLVAVRCTRLKFPSPYPSRSKAVLMYMCNKLFLFLWISYTFTRETTDRSRKSYDAGELR